MANVYVSQNQMTKRYMAMIHTAMRTGTTPILMGEPGIGKTELVKTLAYMENLKLNGVDINNPEEVRNVNPAELEELYPLRILIGATLEPTEVSGLPVVEKTTTRDGQEATIARNTMPSWCYDFTQTGKGILFLDEFNSASPTVQAAMLTMIQGRMVGHYKLPDGVLIIAAANPTEIAVNGFSLPAPLANRLLHIYMESDPDDFLAGFRVGWGKDMDIAEKSMRKEIADFLNVKRHLIQKMPETEEEQGGAWPSRRSWENAVTNMALIPDMITQQMLLTGFVGSDAAQSFFANRKLGNLPATSEIISNGINWDNYPIDAILQIVKQSIVDTTADTISEIVDIFINLAESGRSDIAYSQFLPLMDKIKEVNNGKIDQNLVSKFFNSIKDDTRNL